MSFWSEIDDLIDKGKTDKAVKVTAQELIDIRAEMIEDKGKLEALELEYEKLKEENLELATIAGNADKQVASMQQSLDTQVASQVQAGQQKFVEIQQQNQDLLNQNRTLTQKIHEMQSMQDHLVSNEEIEGKDRQIAALNLNVQEISNQLENLRGNQVSKEDFDALKFQNQQYQQQIAAGTQQLAALQHQIEDLKVELAHKDKKIRELMEPRPVMAPTLAKAPSPTPSASTGFAGGEEVDIGLRRNQCPKCGGVKIREMEDKTKIVSYIPKVMYGHKLVCQTCRYEWSI
jgi:predicted RNase H-like nuclease (RuvC/YqgF family)